MTAVWEEMPTILYTISVWVALSNSSVNSIIYGAMNYNFRQGYRLFFSKLFCLRSCRRYRKMRCHKTRTTSSSGDHSFNSTSISKGTSPESSLTQVV
jgi:hypothetical protein